MKRFILLSTALASIAFLSSAAEPLKAQTILKMVQERGAHATVEAMWENPSWDEIIQQVATGSAQWLTVAAQLHRGSDSGSSSELRDAVAWALAKAPEQVLLKIAESRSTVGPSGLFTVGLCSGPSVDFPHGDYKVYYTEAKAAVGSVSNTELKSLRSECLRALNAASDKMDKKP
jgi:hypothetical protein